MADAQYRHRPRPLRHGQQFGKPQRIEHRHPAQPQPFGTRRQPHVLDRAGHRGKVHLGHRAAPEDVRLAPLGKGDDEHLGGIHHPFDLQAHESLLALAERTCGGQALLLDQCMHARAQGLVGNADEAPWLHVANAGRMVCGPQQTLQDFRRHRGGNEMAHVAPFGNGPVNRRALERGKWFRCYTLFLLQDCSSIVVTCPPLPHTQPYGDNAHLTIMVREHSMQDPQALYSARRMTPADAVALIKDGDAVVVPTGVGEAPTLLHALSERRHHLHDVSVSQILPLRKYAYIDASTRARVRHDAYFFGGATRPGGHEGWVDFVPAYFSELPMLIERGLTPADVVVSMASPMDEHGYFSLSLAPDYTMAAVAKARVVLLEVNPHVPFANGNCHVHISQVSAVVESEEELFEVGLPAIGPVQEAIGQYVADLIDDGSTLQIGYGGIPDAVVQQLKHKHDLGIHTEMIGDGILSLVEAGAVTNRRKTFMPGKMVATFALGSRRLYRFLHRNPMLEMHPVDFTNDPWIAARNDRLCAINATLQIDLLGQCGSESLGHLPYSGTGGQVDFVRAANRSRDGKAFIVLPSTAKGDSISRIVPTLSPGTHVTTSKNDINYVVTEFGVAQLRGKTAKQRAEALIAIAHPDFRGELREAARHLKLG